MPLELLEKSTNFVETNPVEVSSKSADSQELLLKANKDRFVLFPIKYDNLWKMYKKAEASFWTAEEIDLSGDLKYWEKLN